MTRLKISTPVYETNVRLTCTFPFIIRNNMLGIWKAKKIQITKSLIGGPVRTVDECRDIARAANRNNAREPISNPIYSM